MIRFDFETRSRADLGEVGARVYAEDPSTDVLLMAVSLDSGIRIFDLSTDKTFPEELSPLMGMTWAAWNSFFDEGIWREVLHKRHGWPMPARIFDDAALARNHNLPAGLDDCAKAMQLETRKDAGGKKLISFFCKPICNGSRQGEFREPWAYPVEWDLFKAYCEQDVRTQLAVVEKLPPLASDSEEFWTATRQTNERGVPLDLHLISYLQRMVAHGEKLLDRKIQTLTRKELTAQKVADDHRALASHLGMASVDKLAVKDALTKPLTKGRRFLLEARQTLGQSSTAKLAKMSQQACRDGRAKGIIRFHGADTGRDTSLGINLMNLPRGGKRFKPDSLINLALADDPDGFYKAAGGDASGAAAACLRGCLVPAQDKVFLQCDYAGIEPRVAAWYAGEEWMLDCFRAADAGTGPGLYEVAASKLYACSPSQVTPDQRQSGKVLELQCLYRSGAKKLREQARDVYGVEMTEEEAENGVQSYRALHPMIASYWAHMEDAAMAAIRNPGKVITTGRIKLKHDSGTLYMRLASGRKVAYNRAAIENVQTDYGRRQMIVHWATVGAGGAKKWAKVMTHGGVLWNGVVQGTSNCLLRAACVRLEHVGLPVVLRVYDEVVVEAEESRFDEFKACMLELPAWAQGLPINGSGWVGNRYKK